MECCGEPADCFPPVVAVEGIGVDSVIATDRSRGANHCCAGAPESFAT